MLTSLAPGGKVLTTVVLALREAIPQAPAPKQQMQQIMHTMHGETMQSTDPKAASPSITRMLMPPMLISVKESSDKKSGVMEGERLACEREGRVGGREGGRKGEGGRERRRGRERGRRKEGWKGGKKGGKEKRRERKW